MNTNTTQAAHALLDQAKFNSIAGAFARLQALGDKQIDTGPSDNTAVEKEQLIAYLAEAMLQHIAEFLGAWQLAHLEYLPLLRVIKTVASRAGYLPTPILNAKASVTNNPANN